MQDNIYEYTSKYYPSSWEKFFKEKIRIIKCVSDVIDKDIKDGELVLPEIDYLWNAFIHTGANNVKIVILGQDPYPTIGDAMGLAFSVKKGRDIPKSLINIYDVLSKTVKDFQIPNHGDLTDWAIQGVLLINTAYTIIANKKNSHAKPWSQFTDALIEYLSDNYENLVFMLWGKQAQSYKKFIDKRKHLVLETSHPSPLSFYYGFNTCDHFNQANQYLIDHKKSPVNWSLSD